MGKLYKFGERFFMEAIKLIGISHEGKLTVWVPKEFDGKELEVIILTSKGKENKKIEDKVNKKRTREVYAPCGFCQTS